LAKEISSYMRNTENIFWFQDEIPKPKDIGEGIPTGGTFPVMNAIL
jgi:hypothetical protein